MNNASQEKTKKASFKKIYSKRKIIQWVHFPIQTWYHTLVGYIVGYIFDTIIYKFKKQYFYWFAVFLGAVHWQARVCNIVHFFYHSLDDLLFISPSCCNVSRAACSYKITYVSGLPMRACKWSTYLSYLTVQSRQYLGLDPCSVSIIINRYATAR
mgnify:CR=1 FL=1